MQAFTMQRLSGLASSLLPILTTGLLLGSLSGCQLLEPNASKSVLPDSGVLRVKGVAQASHIGKNAAGMPLIEASNFHDLLFTLGYSHASDRLSQMVQLRLLAQGRLAELEGIDALNIDRLMRSINLNADAQSLYKNAPKNLQDYFAIYARGINAYLYQMRANLPPKLAQANYKPEYWKAEDSALLFSLFSFSQSGNLAEEVLALSLAQHLGTEKLAWLLPIHPDEAVALDEAKALQTLASSALQDQTLRNSSTQLLATLNQLANSNALQAPLANSWVSSPQHNLNRRSLLALNTLPPNNAQTAVYSWINLRSPQLQAAGLTLPGTPLLLSGFNGQLAYSTSALMGDTQDVFIEKLRHNNGRLEYFSNDAWQAAQQRMETFFIRDQRPIREALYQTPHGPLISTLPAQTQSGYGLALQRPNLKDDQSLNAVWQLLRSQNVEQATQVAQALRALPANILLADAQHIAWQVVGTYPNRRNSRGLFPVAGWDNNTSWDGYADPMLYPYDQDPGQGWLIAANQRLTPPGYGMQLSSSWASPERAENLAQQLQKKPVSNNLANSNLARPWLVKQLQYMLAAGSMPEALKQATQALPSQQRTAAQQAIQDFLALPSTQPLSMLQSAWLERFLSQAQDQLFISDLQRLPTSTQQAFVIHNQSSYPAWLDHLLGREDSPFWQNSSVSKAQFLIENLLSSQQSSNSAQATASLVNSQIMRVDFAQTSPLSAASFNGQSDNPYSPHYSSKAGTTGKFYPLPLNYKDIEKTYGKQRLTLLPGK